MEVADIYVQAVAEGVAQASVDAGDVIPTAAGFRLEGEDVILVESSGGATTVTKVKGSTKARRNGNRAANLAAVAASSQRTRRLRKRHTCPC